jgi:hypothetical protein
MQSMPARAASEEGAVTERRYSDDEVRRIIELASTRPAVPAAGPGAASRGLTLREIQAIAGEVGISAQDVTSAAVAIDSPPAATVDHSLGMPAAVGRVVPLRRNLTDVEWDRLVGELRATFRARGTVRVVGGLREWSNGNLHASVEPADGGYRLRLGTLKRDASAVNMLGVSGIGMGAAILAGTLLTGNPELAGSFVLAAGGTVAVLANALRLPRWARQRRSQMDHIAATVSAVLDEGE